MGNHTFPPGDDTCKVCGVSAKDAPRVPCITLYKYCKSEHERAFFDRGALRIGTLFYYQDSKIHGAMIGDQSDGRVTMSGSFEGDSVRTIADNPNLANRFKFFGPSEKQSLTIEGMRLSSPNLYIFSTSLAYSDAAHRRWLADPHAQYDSCYRIDSVDAFLAAVSQVIATKATLVGCTRVSYYDSDLHIDIRSPLAKLHPSQLKGGKTYGDQIEARAIWNPTTTGTIDHMDIEVPDAIKYCSPHKRLK
jgi:hypothetical protein